MQKKRRLKKYFAVCFLSILFCAAPAFAASELTGRAVSSGPNKGYFKGFILGGESSVETPSHGNALLNFADGLFIEKKIVSSQPAVKENKWSITPLLNRMTLSSLGDPKNIGLVWKYRF